MSWMQGPINDQAIFWLTIKVFWWKRFITFAQLALAGSIFFNLMKKKHKRAIHSRLVKLCDRTQNVVVPPLVRFRTLLAYSVPCVGLIAAAFAGVVYWLSTRNGQTIPFCPTWFAFAFLWSLIAVLIGEVIIIMSVLRTSVRSVQRYGPSVLAWAFDHRTFDRNISIAVFVALAAVTTLQICLS